MLIQENNKQKNHFIRAFSVLLYAPIPIGAFLLTPFLLMVFIYHQKPDILFGTGIIEALFLLVPIFIITLTQPKHSGRYALAIRLFIFGLISFGLLIGIIFLKVLLTLLGAFLSATG